MKHVYVLELPLLILTKQDFIFSDVEFAVYHVDGYQFLKNTKSEICTKLSKIRDILEM